MDTDPSAREDTRPTMPLSGGEAVPSGRYELWWGRTIRVLEPLEQAVRHDLHFVEIFPAGAWARHTLRCARAARPPTEDGP